MTARRPAPAPSTDGTSAAAARQWLARGVYTIPLSPRSKRPTAAGWPDLRLTAAEVDAAFPPDANIGVLLGAPSGGLVDVDLDSSQATAAAAHLLPATGLVGGRQSAPASHWWYIVDAPPDAASTPYDDPAADRGTDRRLVELRSTGGQTVVPPSIYPPDDTHPSEPCVWHRHGEPARVPIIELSAAVRGVAAAALIGRYWPGGARHDAALALSGGLLRAGWDRDRVETFMQAVCAAAGDDEMSNRVDAIRDSAETLSRGEHATGWPSLARIIGSRGEGVVSRVREWLGVKSTTSTTSLTSTTPAWQPPVPLPELPPVPLFPVHLFPEPLSRYWLAKAEALHVPVDYVAGPSLAVMGAAVGRSRAAQVKDGYAESPLFWIPVIAPPGTTKSESLRAARSPLDQEEARWLQQFHDQREEYELEMAQYEAELKTWKESLRPAKKRGKATKEVAEPMDVPEAAEKPQPPKKPRPPVCRQSVLDDTTAEAAARTLNENPRGVIILKDELIGFARMLNQYKGGKGNDKTFWLTGWNGKGIAKVNRSKDHHLGPLVSHDPFTAVGGMLCPDCLPELREELHRGAAVNDGWADRFLPLYPDPLDADEERWAIVPDPIVNGYAQIILDLLALEMVPVEDLEQSGGEQEDPSEDEEQAREATYRPYYVHFDDDARKAWGRFTRQIAEKTNSYPKGDPYRGVLSKLKHNGVRLACLLHCIEVVTNPNTDRGRLAGVFMERAAELVWHFEAHSRRCLGIGDRATDPARRLLAVLRDWPGDEFTKRELHRRVHGQTHFRLADSLDAPLRLLTAHGFIAPTDPNPKPGRPCERFAINTLWERNPDDGSANGAKTRPTPGNPGESDEKPGQCQMVTDSAKTRGCVRRGITLGSFGTVCHHLALSPEREENTLKSASLMGFGTIGTPLLEKVGKTRITEDPPNSIPSGSGDPHRRLIVTRAALSDVESAIEDGGGPIGLDIETSGLSHHRDRVRLIQLATARGTFVIDVFAFPDPAASLAPLFETLTRTTLIGHNLAFDLPFLSRLGFTPGRVFDTMLASQILTAGDRQADNTLRAVAKHHLDIDLDKTDQRADWSGPLSPTMLRYAALDAEVPVRLRELLTVALSAAKLTATADLENAALPAVVWASVRGVGFDRSAWEQLAANAEADRDRLAEALDKLAPNPGTWTSTTNWNSPDQVQAAFKALGIDLDSTDDDTLATTDHPLAATLRDYRSVSRLASTYGRQWLEHVSPDGRVYATWKQIGAGASGRMSCKEPNLQQLPRDPRYRRCFLAPPGRILVKADYSQIELRIAARLTKDKRMLDAYRNGEDLHTLTASTLLGKPACVVTKADRQLAKAVNFGLLYGQGAKGLMGYAKSSYGVVMRGDEAGAHRDAFFRTYSGLRKWHSTLGDEPRDTRTLTGRRRLTVQRFTERANTPVQGTGADGLKKAMALLWERRDRCPGAFPVLFVHDELVIEAGEGQQDQAAAWVREAMVDGMAPIIDPVPVAVEVSIGRTWGGA